MCHAIYFHYLRIVSKVFSDFNTFHPWLAEFSIVAKSFSMAVGRRKLFRRKAWLWSYPNAFRDQGL
jgi:hypothetical protein